MYHIVYYIVWSLHLFLFTSSIKKVFGAPRLVHTTETQVVVAWKIDTHPAKPGHGGSMVTMESAWLVWNPCQNHKTNVWWHVMPFKHFQAITPSSSPLPSPSLLGQLQIVQGTKQISSSPLLGEAWRTIIEQSVIQFLIHVIIASTRPSHYRGRLSKTFKSNTPRITRFECIIIDS